MGREFNAMKEHVIPITADGDLPWEKITGREIYELDTITNLNRVPVKVLGSFIQGGAKITGNTDIIPELPDLIEHLLVDGTIVIFTETLDDSDPPQLLPIPELVFMTNIIYATKTKVIQVQLNYSPDGKEILRVFKLEGDRWNYEDITAYGTEDERVIKQSEKGIAAAHLYVYPNKTGILYDAQFTYRRLEEIERQVRKVNKNAITMIVKGYLGMMEQLIDAVRAGVDDNGALAVPDGSSVEIPKTTTVVDQLHKDYRLLLPAYFKMTNLVEFDDSQPISGISRRLLMQQTLEFTTLTREQIKEIYKNWNAGITFESIPTMSADERMKELDFLDRMKDNSSITKAEHKIRAKALL
jgi:hypothetical protein